MVMKASQTAKTTKASHPRPRSQSSGHLPAQSCLLKPSVDAKLCGNNFNKRYFIFPSLFSILRFIWIVPNGIGESGLELVSDFRATFLCLFLFLKYSFCK